MPVSIRNCTQTNRDLMFLSSPSPRPCAPCRYPAHFQTTHRQRLGSKHVGHRKRCRILRVSLRRLYFEPYPTCIPEEISISRNYFPLWGLHNWRCCPSSQLCSCSCRKLGCVSMSRNASCSLHRKYHLHDIHPIHVPRRSGPKGFRQELKELRETLMTLPSVIRRIVRSRILISGSAVTSSGSAGSNSCSFLLLSFHF